MLKSKSGIVVKFGYNLSVSVAPNGEPEGRVRMGTFDELHNKAFIDLADFNKNGSIRTSTVEGNKSFSNRSDNLARVMEHEILQHGFFHCTDDRSQSNPTGETEANLNLYRVEMGIFTRDSYDYSDEINVNNGRNMYKIVGRSYTGPNGEKATMFYNLTELNKAK